MAQEFLIALGSNLGSDAGNPEETLTAAVHAMAERGLRTRRLSRYFSTPCFPPGAGPDYANACIAVDGPDTAETALDVLHSIEAEFGRLRSQRWGSRSLDLDLLAAGQAVRPDAETQSRWRALPTAEQPRQTPDRLILPHPRLQDRAFVLVPLADIAAGWQHPLTGETVARMLAALPAETRAEAVPL